MFANINDQLKRNSIAALEKNPGGLNKTNTNNMAQLVQLKNNNSNSIMRDTTRRQALANGK